MFTDANKTEYKSTYQFLKDISEIYNDLTDKNQAALLETIGGKRGAQSLAGILADFSEVERAMDEMKGAAGAADKEMEVIQDSIDYKLNALKQTWIGVLQDVTSREGFKNILDGLTSLSEGLGGIISQLGLVKTAIVGISTVVGSQRLGLLKYNKNTGFSVGEDLPLRDVGKNKRLLNQGNNRKFLEKIEGHYSSKTTINPEEFNTRVEKYANRIGDVNDELITLAEETYKNDGNLKGLTKTFEGQTSVLTKFGSTLKNIGGQVISTFVNGIVSAGVSLAISMIVQGIHDLIKSDELLAQKTQEISAKYNEQKNQISDYSKRISELKSTIQDSNSTTVEVKEATSELYKIQNDLISQYGSYHAGIDLVNGDLDEQLKLLRNINQENARRALNDINSEKSNKSKAINLLANAGEGGIFGYGFGGRFLRNYFADNKGFKESVSDAYFGGSTGDKVIGTSSKQIKEQVENYNGSFRTNNETVQRLARNYKEAFKVYENGKIEAIGNIYEVNDAVISLQTQLESLGITDEKVFAELGEMASETSDKINTYGDSYNTIIEAEIQSNHLLSKSYRDLNSIYNDYIKAQNSGDDNKVQELGEEFIKALGDIENSGIDEKYIQYFENMYPELQQVVSGWKFETDVMPVIDRFKGQEEWLQQTSADDIKSQYKYYTEAVKGGAKDKVDPYIRGRMRNLEEAAKKAGYDTVEAFVDALKLLDNFSDKFQYLRDIMGENFDEEFAKSLTDEQWAFLVGLELDKDNVEYTKEEIQDELNPVEIEIEPKASDLVADLDKMEDDWGALQTAYNSSVTEGNVLSASELQGVTDQFGGIGKDSEGNWNAMSSSLDNYNEKLVQNAGDTEVAQKAANELATSYLDLTGTLDELIDEDANYAIEVLKQKGIENAEEVVQSRLNKTYKGTREKLQDLAEAYAQYSDALEKSNKTAEDFNPGGQFEGLTDQVAALIGEYNQETGAFVNPADIDGQFMADNWGLVEDAIHGVDGAVDELYVKLAMVNAQKVMVSAGMDASEIDSKMSGISQMLAIASTWTMEPQALLEDSQFKAALQSCWDGSVETANAINAALGTIGMKVQYKTTTKTIRVAKGSDKNAHTVYGGDNAGKVMTADKIEVDDFEIVTTPTGKGSVGSGARIGGGSTGSGTGGGGGGNGGGSGSDSSKDESEQTFDWVEVAIKRVEDQINHLDEAVENVYSMWTNRNKKLRDEIAKTTKELEIQTVGAEIYKAKAEQVGLDKSYAKKIQQGEYYDYVDKKTGLRSTKSIETITDETLIKKIQEYQQWWDKYKQAQYAQQTLEIKLGELYKKNFDQWKENYEEQINIVQAYADLVDKRITRVQERGYFESQKYYKQLINYEVNSMTKQRAELNELIKARDEAVASGKIKKNSQAWREMTQDILSTAGAIEESTTNLIKFNNQIRQLNWDVFDFAEERIDQINQEADFLIDLLDNQKMYKDTGNFNQRGWGAVEMRAVKYDTYMQQSRDYAKERAKIEKDLAKDPADKELIKRKEELIKLQQESIKNAYAEKEAVKDLVQEGINIHLD